VDGPATVTIKTWTNCGNNRCGFITDADGYDELAWQKIDAINVVPKTRRKHLLVVLLDGIKSDGAMLATQR
jgi:hypothetical protein